MESSEIDLRKVLSQNIKKKRKELGITQVRLAELANISEPYMNDIERCQTWVSDKTLLKLAQALFVKPYELFISENEESKTEANDLSEKFKLLEKKKKEFHQNFDKFFDEAFLEIIHSFTKRN